MVELADLGNFIKEVILVTLPQSVYVILQWERWRNDSGEYYYIYLIKKSALKERGEKHAKENQWDWVVNSSGLVIPCPAL